MAQANIDWPDNITAQGQLAFPLKSVEEIVALKEWREKKNFKKPKFPDRVGGTLILNQINYDKVVEYMEKTYLPFVDVLYKETDGSKGVAPDVVKSLLAQVKKREWLGPDNKPNLPIRTLTDKDRENMRDYPGVAKIAFSGPPENGPLEVAAIVVDSNGKRSVIDRDTMSDEDILPKGGDNIDRLWWGSGWVFRTSLRLNAYDSASQGVSAYANKLYLIPHLGMPLFGGGGQDGAVIAEDGDDAGWE